MTKLADWLDQHLTHEHALMLVTAGVFAGTFLGSVIPDTHLNSFLLATNIIWIWK